MKNASAKEHLAKTILLVEDEAVIAMKEAAILEKNGYKVVKAYNAEKAITALTEREIDLVLMDIDLGRGKMDGTETAEVILQNHDIPVVFLTSHSEKEMVEKVKGITRYGYVLKNAGEFVLIESISMAFELFEAHRKMKESKENYQLIFNSINDAIIFQDLQSGEILDVNPKALEMYGYGDKKEMIGAFTDQFSSGEHGYTKEAALHYITKAAGGEPQLFEWMAKKKNGNCFWVEVNLRVARIGNEPKIIATVRNITERFEAEQAMRNSEARLKTLLENMPVPLVVSRGEREEVVSVNKKFVEVFGYDQNDIPDVTTWFEKAYPDEKYRTDVANDWNSRMRSAMQTRCETEPISVNVVCKDGTERFVSVRALSLGDMHIIVFLDLSGKNERTVKE